LESEGRRVVKRVPDDEVGGVRERTLSEVWGSMVVSNLKRDAREIHLHHVCLYLVGRIIQYKSVTNPSYLALRSP